MTQLDELNAALGTELFSEQLIEWIKKLKEERKALQDMIDAANAAQKAAGEGEGEGEGEGRSGGEGKPGDGDSNNKGKGKTKEMTLEEAMKLYEEAKKKFEAATKEKDFVQGVERIVSRIKDTVRETSEMIGNWGLERSESFTRRPCHEKMALLEKLRSSSKLQQIAKLAGRYRLLAMQARREKVKRGIDDLHSITQGKDLSRLIPSEIQRYLNPLTKLQFMADYTEGKTLMYEIRGRQKKMKGPIICCIDESGSMDGAPEIFIDFN